MIRLIFCRTKITVLSILLLITSVGGIIGNRLYLDGLYGCLAKFLFKDTTVFSIGYSDKHFKELTIGMKLNQAVEIMGDPVLIDNIGNVLRLHYSSSPSDSHYSARQLYFQNGQLIDIKHYYIID